MFSSLCKLRQFSIRRAVCQAPPPTSAQNTHKDSLYYNFLWDLVENHAKAHKSRLDCIYTYHESRLDQASYLHLVENHAIITLYSTISTSYVRRLRIRLHGQWLRTRSRRLCTRSRWGVCARWARLRNACISPLRMIWSSTQCTGITC